MMMNGILSPIMKKMVDDEKAYPSPSAKVKINKAIGRYKLLATGQKWKDYMEDIRFALADLLVARGEPQDYKEALKYYEQIIEKGGNDTMIGRSLIGKAELAISGIADMSVKEAIELCKRGVKLLKNNADDFFGAKGIAVEAELLVSEGLPKSIKAASKLFDSLVSRKKANAYFRARASVGKAELILYHGLDSLSKGIKLCEDSLKLLSDRPIDYFAVKARVIQAEMLVRRGSSSDLHKAETLCDKVISSSSSNKDLAARAKLVLAEVSKKERAEKLYEEVLEQDGIDPYLLEKARFLEKNFKSRLN